LREINFWILIDFFKSQLETFSSVFITQLAILYAENIFKWFKNKNKKSAHKSKKRRKKN